MSDDLPPLSEAARTLRVGIYRHYKGGLYRVLCVGRSSEEREKEFVVYQSIEKNHIWIRPLPMFLEEVEVGEYHGPRFAWVGEDI